jgi:hypothetical protein
MFTLSLVGCVLSKTNAQLHHCINMAVISVSKIKFISKPWLLVMSVELL